MTDDGWIREERRHEREMAELRLKKETRQRNALTDRITAVAAATAVIAVAAIIAWLVWALVSPSGERAQELHLACTAEQGTWVSLGDGPKVCVWLKDGPP